MKIAVDIDEVLADSLSSYLNYFNNSFGTSIRKEDFVVGKTFWEVLGVAEEKRDEIRAHYDKHPLSKDWILIPGSQKGIKKLAENNELVVISNRMPPRFDATKQWLERNFDGVFKETYFTEADRDGETKPAKAEICERVGALMLLEDSPEEALECVRRGIGVVLFDTYLNQGLGTNKRIARVKNWDEALRAVEVMRREVS